MRRAALALAAAAAFAAAGCGNGAGDHAAASSPAAGPGRLIARVPGAATAPAITIGSKNFTEQFILGEIYAQALEAAGFRVKRQFNLGSEQIAYKTLRAGRIDAYPEYTGTILTSFCGVRIAAVPRSATKTYNNARSCLAPRSIAALPPTPFTDSEAFAVTQQTADALGVSTLSELAAKAPSLRIASAPECAQRPDCLLGLQRVYGARFKRFISIDIAKRYDVLVDHQVDVSSAFTTDGQIKADNLVLLADDRHLFPPYNATLLVRQDAARAAGAGLRATVAHVQAGLTTAAMRELNSRVDLDKQTPAAVAGEYLREAGYRR